MRRVFCLLAVFASQAQADLAPEPKPFDGECVCEIECGVTENDTNVSSRSIDIVFQTVFAIQPLTAPQTDGGAAASAKCGAEATTARESSATSSNISPRALVVRACLSGGKDKGGTSIAKCSDSDGCSESKVNCFAHAFSRRQ